MANKNILPEFNAANISLMAIQQLEKKSDKQREKFVSDLFSNVKKHLSDGSTMVRIKFQGVKYYPGLSDEDMIKILKERGFNDVEITEGHDVDCSDHCSSKNGCNKWLYLKWNVNRKRKRQS